MKRTISKTQVKEKIDLFFKEKNFSPFQVRKIKRLAMKYKIRLGKHKELFCSSCLNYLTGKIKINKNYKTIKCSKCGKIKKIIFS